MYETGAINSPEATSGTTDGAPIIQTPSWAEHAPGQAFLIPHVSLQEWPVLTLIALPLF